MTDLNFKETIIRKAVEIFSSKGYHGTSMRDIAGAAECSLPTLYYHYKSKNDLHDEIVLNQFGEIREKLHLKFERGISPAMSYATAIKQIKGLAPYEKAVFKMVLKVIAGLEGSEPARKTLLEWEGKRMAENRKTLDKFVRDEAVREDFAALYVRVVENMIQKIVLLDENISDRDIENQLTLLFKLAD